VIPSVWKNTTYTEVHDEPPGVQCAPDASRVTRCIQLDSTSWDAIFQAYTDFIGYSKVITAGGKRWISRELPHSFLPSIVGERPEYVWCSAQTQTRPIRMDNSEARRGKSADRTIPGYKYARINFEYGTRLYDLKEDEDVLTDTGPLAGCPDEGALERFIVRHFKGTNALVTIPRGPLFAFPFGADTFPLHEGFPFPVTTIQCSYRHMQVPVEGIPWLAIQRCSSTVNLFDFDHGRFPAGTLLYKDSDYSEYVNVLGRRIADVTHNFMARFGVDSRGGVLGWNSTLGWNETDKIVDFMTVASRAAGGGFGTKPFRYVDHRTLFRPDQP
jgi:hypothetical protein